MHSFILFILLSLFFAVFQDLSAQNPVIYRYGGQPDIIRKESARQGPALNFSISAYWGDLTFSDYAYFSNAHFTIEANFQNSVFLDAAYFQEATFERNTHFQQAEFKKYADYDSTTFNNNLNFYQSVFHKAATFDGATFLGDETIFRGVKFAAASFKKAHFRGMTDFRNTHFHSTTTFQNAQFDSTVQLAGSTFANASFQGTLFGQHTQLDSAVFSKGANFSSAQFRGRTSFNKTQFVDFVDFSQTVFATVPTFEATQFAGKVDFSFAQCEKGLDLRTANFDSATAIYLEGLQVQNGNFFVRWDQLNYRNGYRLQVKVDSSVKNEYIKLEAIYYNLRDNFLAQNDQVSADNVMHELAERRYLLDSDKGFWKWSYGFFLGYGYVPWRFLLYIVLPSIILFAVFWYAFYGEIVLDVLQKNEERTQSVKDSLKSMPFIVKMWYMIYFSSSVLFGIHFRKDWIHHQKPLFVFWITVQWLFGIALFVVFAVYVTNSHLQYVGGVLGL